MVVIGSIAMATTRGQETSKVKQRRVQAEYGLAQSRTALPSGPIGLALSSRAELSSLVCVVASLRPVRKERGVHLGGSCAVEEWALAARFSTTDIPARDGGRCLWPVASLMQQGAWGASA